MMTTSLHMLNSSQDLRGVAVYDKDENKEKKVMNTSFISSSLKDKGEITETTRRG